MTHDNRIDLQRPDAPELAAPGPGAVGVATLTLTNPDQQVARDALTLERAG